LISGTGTGLKTRSSSRTGTRTEFYLFKKKLGKKNLEPGVDHRLTIGFRGGYLEPKLKPGLMFP
jgi:hypothetical protein